MFFRQVLYRDLGCASYLLGDAGDAIVVDPRWDIEVYLEIAALEHLEIRYVLDTHDHADHVSGRRRLAEATGARSLTAVGPEDAGEDGITPGAELAVGSLRIQALGTPGHRPEHLAFAVLDLSRGSDPWLVLTGDSLLVGDIARPDLAVEAVEGATLLHSSLQSLIALGDQTEVWPGHVGGSLCGGANLSGKPSSTIGFERLHNPLLLAGCEDFVSGLTANLPVRPPNVARIVDINRTGDGEPPDVHPLSSDRVHELLRSGVTVLDGRAPESFDEGHLAAAINLPSSSHGVGTRAGWMLSPDEPVVIAADDCQVADSMVIALQAVGLWNIAGLAIGDSGVWHRQGLPTARADSWDLVRLAGSLRRDEVDLVDVRDTPEWIAGHVPGSHHLPLDRLGPGTSVALPDRGRTTAVACAAGGRAAFAASLLRRAGRRDVVRLAGGGVADLSSHGIDLAVGA